MYQAWIKRTFDIFVSLFLLVILSPFMILIGLLVRLMIGRPVLFRQKRPGRDEKVFTMIKFRTMKIAYDSHGELLTDEERMTRFGKLLRKTSLDELPELWNVLKGDMSLVGPRPLLIEYLPLYDAVQRKRHAVRPGITGLAQINGRNAISWKEKLDYDVTYVKNVSLKMDFKILFKTVLKVILLSDTTAKNHATTARFKGNEDER